MNWEPHDPRRLIDLAQVQHPDKPWLAEALAACTSCHWESRSRKYLRFIDAIHANQPGSLWQFDQNLWLEDPREGRLLLDVLTNHRIGGVEFYDRLFSS
jgi:hypothetical protein